MKLAFISDIHGNAIALEAVLQDMAKHEIDRIYVLGDLCYRGPDPKRSLSLVRSLNTQVIKGNADEWVVRGVNQGEVPEQVIDMMKREREWTVAQLDEQDIAYLVSLPTEMKLEIEGISIHAFHATPDSLFEIVLPGVGDEVLKSKLMSASDADIFIYAHIHRPFIRYMEGKILLNTGSVGLPFDGMSKAAYAIVEIENGQIRTSIERVPFRIEDVVKQYEEVHYPNAEMMTKIVRNGLVK
ncbi:putative phosphoesterase [Paenibacillus sp. V4I3]|uniref:metallophosphoesterase family protein n=1 Tax=unclassified Paenibacillus TaxID=185978 RepID=UPI00277E187E|nr:MULTISPECIES: metallophosphoesterase family protein [unclassified Paenibacillus]MDQ0874183.1 putative phosphoesterase [Paenibacillus sp. V4I3]MDQ0889940.1 putative phosphoesterase [Paenibacillus sp. V4I9]